jgi:3-oxoacyl-[acyl-carrier protein] reductase
MSGRLQDRTVLITGASRGIGAATVRAVAKGGARVIVHYGRGEDEARVLLKEIDGRGWIIQADLAHRDGARRLWEAAEKAASRIDAVVNNAGIRTPTRIEDDLRSWQEAWHREMQVNVFAAVDLCRFAIVHFRKHGGGKIVNMSSRAGQRGHLAEFMPYAASKAALINVTKSIARSLAHERVIAVAIAPGFVRTNMADEFIAMHGKHALFGELPLKEIPEAEEVVLDPLQRSLNGATLDINGASYVR